MNRYYAGVGSREACNKVIEDIFHIAKALARSHVLRSGGADGADLAFEGACDEVWGKKEIFLPYKGFNGSTSNLYHIPEEAFAIAEAIHPAYKFLKQGVKKLHARNVQQVLGYDLKTPSEFVICWTKDGKAVGGTATAINLAISRNIPVYNLATMTVWEILDTVILGDRNYDI